jgi:hypothetical protein
MTTPEEETGIERLRCMRNVCGNGTETFNQQWSVAQLDALYDAYHKCGWDIPPDHWSEAQIAEALHGNAPEFCECCKVDTRACCCAALPEETPAEQRLWDLLESAKVADQTAIDLDDFEEALRGRGGKR